MSAKEDMKRWLETEDWEGFQEGFRSNPWLLRHLMGFLYHPQEEMRWRAVKGFGLIAHILPDEKIKDLLRRMMWSLNDESGTCCWFTPQAIGEIGYQRPDLVKDFLPCLKYYVNDPDATLREGAQWALERIAQTGLEIPEEAQVPTK